MEEAEDEGKNCEDEMIKLAAEKERTCEEEMIKLAEEKAMEEAEDEEPAEEAEKAEEEPSTAGEKRPSSESPGGTPAKKLCLEGGETSSIPCEVSSTSLQNSNGSSTSTKPATADDTEAISENDLLKMAAEAAEEEAASSSAAAAAAAAEVAAAAAAAVSESAVAAAVSEAAATKEGTSKEVEEDNGNNSESTEAEKPVIEAIGEEEENVASKLLASGISVSFIKKKKSLGGEEDKSEAVKDKPSDDQEKSTSLDIGPNISVTMIQKEKAERKSSAPARSPSLSIKSPGELLETPRRVSSQLDELKDSISVSRVQRSPATTPRPPHLAPQVAGPQLLFPQFAPPAAGLPPGLAMGPPAGHGPMGMPGLHPRPGGPANRPPPPLASGPVSEQLAQAAGGLADYMRMGLEDLLREMSAQGSPQATIKGLQLELEKMSWRHQQELTEMKQNVEIMMKDMKSNLEKENSRIVEQFKKAAEVERQKAVEATKKKQWCANCTKEAIFYCCWNTSYCDYPCQQAHWPTHLSTCSQANQDDESAASTNGTPGATAPAPAPEPEKVARTAPSPHTSTPNPQLLAAEQLVSLGMPRGQVMGMPAGMGFTMGGMAGMRPQFGMPRASMGLSIRPGIPGQLTISRPYFM